MRFLAAVCCPAAISLTGGAAPVQVGDPSFEINRLSSGQRTHEIGPQWTGTKGSRTASAFEQFGRDLAASHGTDHLGVVAGYRVWQDLNAVYQPDTIYTLTVAVGNRNGITTATNSSRYHLAAPGMPVSFATTAFNASKVRRGFFADAPPLVLNTAKTPSAAGKRIRIILHAQGGGTSHFDHIRLDARPAPPAPLPAPLLAPATMITRNTATLSGSVAVSSAPPPSITLFHGDTDGGTDPAAWPHVLHLGANASGTFSTSIGSLTPGTTYYFRAQAIHPTGTAWSSTTGSFQTMPVVPAIVKEQPTQEITAASARIGGAVIDDGGAVPSITLFMGTSDGGEHPESWQTSIELGIQSGVWQHELPGLAQNTTYFHRIRAVNSGGVSWSPGSSFKTATVRPVINEIHHTPGEDPQAGRLPLEFVEIHNPGDAVIPLGNWRLAGAIDYLFPADVMLPPGGYLCVARDPLAFSARFGILPLGPFSGRLSGKGETLSLRDAKGIPADVVSYGSGFPWPTAAKGGGPSMELLHPSLDNGHAGSWRSGTGTIPLTPGSPNSVLVQPAKVPPQVSGVTHSPLEPATGTDVTITARIEDADGLQSVTCSYQIVSPGSYISLTNPSYNRSQQWLPLVMTDDGTGGDSTAGDGVFTCVVPGTIQTHRRLIRYRITAVDSPGNSVVVPHADDEQPNFAYFVYDGVPAWTGAFRPSLTPKTTFSPELLETLPPYHLIASSSDVTDCQYSIYSRETRFHGTLVHAGVVYDHVQFKIRGEASTYVSGKNKWKLFFNRARDFQATDNLGRPYRETWNNLVLNANASPWAAVNRGSAGIEEAACARLYELAGNTGFHTHYVHWRVIDSALEQSTTSQYDSDLWGLYLAIEPTEGNLFEERGLPDASVYDILGINGDKKHQGEGLPLDNSDWNEFRSGLVKTGQSEEWYRANMDLPRFHTFLAINRLTGNVDLRPYANYRYLHRTSDRRWEIMAYDLDMQFIAAHHRGGSLDGVTVAGQPAAFLAVMRHPSIALEYRNRCRELLDLVASDPAPDGGQIGQLIDEYARIVDPKGSNGKSWAYVDAFMWNTHTRTRRDWSSAQSNHYDNFFRSSYSDGPRGMDGIASSYWLRTMPDPDGDDYSDFQAVADRFVGFATDTYPDNAVPWVRSGSGMGANRQHGFGYEYLRFESLYGGFANALAEPTGPPDLDYPAKPVITPSGSPGFPVHDVRFTSSAFADPNGAETFGAMEWRLAEISAPGIAGHQSGAPRKYEIEAVWKSGESGSFVQEVKIPAGVLTPGATYRARVRHKDLTGRWSHWSDPVRFTASPADVSPWREHLMISEIMYHPAVPVAGETGAGGSASSDDYEFIELCNVSATTVLELSDLKFTKGIEFDFAGSSVTSLAPGACVLVVRDPASFTARYGTGLPVAGVWKSADGLSNSGEEIRIMHASGALIRQFNPNGLFRYDQPPWPSAADGFGSSLTLDAPMSRPDLNHAASWRASRVMHGSPGTLDETNTHGQAAAPAGSREEQPRSSLPDGDWLRLHFTSEDPAITGPQADPDGDGLPNLVEFSMKLDPSVSDRHRGLCVYQEVVRDGVRYPAMTIRRMIGESATVSIVEASSDLADWSRLVTVQDGPAIDHGDGTETVTFRSPLPVTSSSRQWLRLRVSSR